MIEPNFTTAGSGCKQLDMVESNGDAKIRPIDKAAIHRICSGQVVLDLATAVKELVENSLDAGATNIEIRLKEYGSALIEVADNGSGVSPDNYQGLTLKYHTSKISEFSDLQKLTSFGFRGEALSSLCALSNVSVTTRTKDEAIGARLEYDYSGVITSEESVARAVGTTVAISKLFSPLPVRYKEFNRNIRREYGRLLSVLQAYALIARGVRIVCTNQVGKSGRTTIVQTQGSGSIKDNIITVFGSKTATYLEPLDLSVSDGCRVEGFVSRPGAGCGRASGDRQFFYVNGRPVDLPKINRLVNELYGSYNSLQKPMAVLNFVLSPTAYDVNVTPDKRKVFLHMESAFLGALKEALERVYSPDKYTYSINNLETGSLNCKAGIGLAKGETASNWIHQRCGRDASQNLEQNSDDVTENIEAEAEPQVQEDQVCKVPGRSNLVHPSQALSTSGQEKMPSNGFLDLLSFKLKGGVAGSSRGSLGAQVPLKNVMVNSPSQRILQSRLTGFVSRSKRCSEEERDEVASVDKEQNSSDFSPEQTVVTGVKDIPVVGPKLDKKSCYGDNDERSPPPMALKSKPVLGVNQDEDLDYWEPSITPKPKLVIGMNLEGELDQTEPVRQEAEGDLDIEGSFPVELEDKNTRTSFYQDKPDDVAVVAGKQDMPSTLLGDPSVVSLDLNKLRWKGKHGLLHCSDETANRGRPLKKRGFAAATLEVAGVAKGGPEKEAALVAATKELERSFNKADFKHMKVLGQFNLGFILAKLDQDVFIVDQHASDEKYNFERLSKTTLLNRQPLLRPLPVELSAAEEIIVSTHMDTFRQNGFDFVEDEDAPPGCRLQLSAVPFSKNIMFGVGDVQELVGLLANETAPIAGNSPGCGSLERTRSSSTIRPSRVRGMLASRACRSSIMIGDALSKKEMEKVLCHLTDLDAPWNCPHGRPTMRHLVDLSALHQQ